MSKHQITEQRLKQKPDLRLRERLVHYQQYHHPLQEKKHLEVKVNQNMIILNRNMNLTETQEDQNIFKDQNQIPKDQNQIIKDHLLLEKTPKETAKANANAKANPIPTRPDHDTEKDENRTKTHWRKAAKGYLVYQLSKHGWKWQKTQSKNTKVSQTELAQIMIDLLGL